jgi:hypothetical protein
MVIGANPLGPTKILFMEFSKKEFYQIIEHNEWEGETWKFFLVKEGNEKFIEKFKNAIKRFDEYEEYFEIKEELVPEFEVDILVKHADSKYMMSHNKCDKILDPKIIKVKNKEVFFSSSNKGGYFE